MKCILLPLLTSSLLFSAEGPLSPLVDSTLNPTGSLSDIETSLPTFNDLEPAPVFNNLPKQKSVFWSGTLNSLFPGLGHIYLEDPKTAAALFSSASLGITAALSSDSQDVKQSSWMTYQNISFYSAYATYRDVRNYNGQSNYKHRMPIDSLSDLTYAPFNLKILRKPQVWGGLLGALGLALTTGYFVHNHSHIKLAGPSHFALSPLAAFPVAIGEESYFRGYLQSQFSETFSPTTAIVLSSAAFGAVHIPNANALDPELRSGYYAFSLPLITAFGAYFGWMTYKNHSLQESVALHAWYDFVIFAAAWAAQPAAASIGKPSFSVSIPF